jgi:hypothetical protein
MTTLDDKLDQLQQQFWKLEKSKDMAIKLMKHGKISRENELAWHTVIYNLRLLIVSAKRKSLKDSSGAEIEKIKAELRKGLLLAKDLIKTEKKN